MIPLTNYDFQWARSELVIIYPDQLLIFFPHLPRGQIILGEKRCQCSTCHLPWWQIQQQWEHGVPNKTGNVLPTTTWEFTCFTNQKKREITCFTNQKYMRVQMFYKPKNMGIQYCIYKQYLVGGFNPSEKYSSHLGLSFPIYGKKHVPNHQAGIVILRVIHLHVCSTCFSNNRISSPIDIVALEPTCCKAVILGIWNQPVFKIDLRWDSWQLSRTCIQNWTFPIFWQGKAPSKSVRYITGWWIFPFLLMNWWTPSFSCWKCCVWRWSRTENSQLPSRTQ